MIAQKKQVQLTAEEFVAHTLDVKTQLIRSFNEAATDEQKAGVLNEAADFYEGCDRQAEEWGTQWDERAKAEWPHEFETYAQVIGGRIDWEKGSFNVPGLS